MKHFLIRLFLRIVGSLPSMKAAYPTYSRLKTWQAFDDEQVSFSPGHQGPTPENEIIKQLDLTIKYSEYIATKLDTGIQHANYLSDNIEAIIEFLEKNHGYKHPTTPDEN